MQSGAGTEQNSSVKDLSDPTAFMEKQLIELIPDPSFAIDHVGVVIAWNTAMEEFTGVLASDVLGKSDYEHAQVYYKTRRPVLIDLVLNPDEEIERKYSSIREKDAIISEIQFTRDNGGKVLFRAKAKPIYDREGAVVGAIETIRDITERKKTEEALRNSESKYRSIFENVSDFLIVHDMEGKLIETNLASKMEIGYTADDVAGMSIIDLMPDQYKPLFKEYMDDLIKNGRQEGLISILTKEGSERVIEYKNLLIVDSYGEPVCVQGSGRDITERIKAEKALKISEERYRNILDSIEEAYFEVDLEGRFTYFQ